MATKRALDDTEDFFTDNYPTITKRLDVKSTVYNLIGQRLLTISDKKIILKKTTEQDQAAEILDTLIRNGKCTSDKFITILWETKQYGLLDELNKYGAIKRQASAKVEGLKAPKTLKAVETNHHLIKLAWEEVEDSETLVGYLVEQSPAGKKKWNSAHEELDIIDKAKEPQLDVSTESYQEYDFRVKAVYEIDDQYMYSDPTLLRRVVAKLLGQPFPPRRLQVESCNCNNVPKCVTLTWMGPVAIDRLSNISYIIEKSLYLNDTKSDWESWECCATTTDCKCKLQDGLEVGSTYRFRVLAENKTNGKISEATEMDGAEIRIHVDLKESKRPHFKRIAQTDVPLMLFNNKKTRLKTKEDGSVILVFSCDDQDSLIELWEMYEQQKVHQVLQKLFVSEELRACGVSPEDLTVTINPEDFEAGQKHLSLTDPTKKGFRVLKVETAHSTGQKVPTPVQESSVYTKPGQVKTYPEQVVSELATSTSQMTMEEDIATSFWTPTYHHLALSPTMSDSEDLYNSPIGSDINMDIEETTASMGTEDHEDRGKHKGQLGHGESALRSGLDPAEHKRLQEDVFQKDVKKYYELKLTHFTPLIWNDNFTLNLNDIFTDLELVNIGQPKLPLSALTQGKQSQKLQSLDGLLDPDVTGQSKAPKCILIEGEAGGGKTTLLSQEALKAVAQKSELGRLHDIVLLIRLREVYEGESIEEMVWDQCVPQVTESIDVQSIRTILLRSESRVLFLLDGYDELRPEARAAGQAIPKLLSGKMYPKSTIVITSRPSAGVQQYTRPDCHIRIMGFSPEHVEKYIQQYFTVVAQQELTKTLAQYVKGNKLLNTLMYTPMMLMLVCLLWEEDQEMVSTGKMTGLYDNLLTCLVRKCCKREGVDMPTEGLPTEFAESLRQLGKLALEALLRNETLLDLRKVERDLNWELLLKLGVVSLEVSASRLHPRKLLNFSHKTFQEFLAGCYVAHASGSQGIDALLQLTSITKALELSNLLQFTCGRDSQAAQAVLKELSKLSSKEFTNLQEKQFERSHVPTHHKVQNICEIYERFAELCLNILGERQELEVMNSFSEVLPIVMLDNSTNSREGAALKYYIQNLHSANMPDRLILKILGDDNSRDTIQYLQQCFITSLPGLKLDLELSEQFSSPDLTARLVSVLKNVPGMRALDLSDTNLTPASLQSLVQGFRHMSLLEELDLSGNCYLRDAGMEVLQVGLFNVPLLAVLRLRNVGMTAVGMSSLAPYMSHLVELREIDISHNENGDTGLESLTTVIPNFRNMQVLILRQTGISPTGMRTLVLPLCELKKLIKLDISDNGIGDAGLEWLAAVLHHLTALKVLVLSLTCISDRGILALIRDLPHLVKLQVLDVSYNNIGDHGILTLVQALCHSGRLNMSLLELYIGFNSGVTGAGLGRISQLISQLLALTRLNMSAYQHSPVHLSDTAAMDLAEALPRLPALEQLDLQNISMDPAGYHAVVQAAEVHPTLETLQYSWHLDPEYANITATSLKMGTQKYLSFIKTEVSQMWRELAYYLDLDDPDIRTITNRNRDDKSRCMDLLMEWQKRQGNAATMDVLMRALIDAGLHSVVDSLKEKYPELSPKHEPKPQAGAEKVVGTAQGSGTKPVVLFINDEYGSSKVGVSTVNYQEAYLLASHGAKVYSTVLDATQKDKKDAEADGVQLIFPTTFKEDRRMPTLEWLTYDHHSRYPNLPSDVDFIVGHVNITSHAARRIKKERLPHAKLAQVTHVIAEDKSHESVLSFKDEAKSILDDLQHADVIFSVGPHMYDYYKSQTRGMKSHHIFLPKPSDIFSMMQCEHVDIGTKVVLSIGRVKGVESLNGYEVVAKAMSIVIEYIPNTKWRAHGVRAVDFPESKNIIQTNIQNGTFQFTPLRYSTQEELSRDMQQANVVLLPSRAEPFGLVGLEAIAAGVPVLVPHKSGIAKFLRSLGPEFDHPVVEIEDDDDEAAKTLAKRIIKVLKDGHREFRAARKLKVKLLASKYWEESHRMFLETFGL